MKIDVQTFLCMAVLSWGFTHTSFAGEDPLQTPVQIDLLTANDVSDGLRFGNSVSLDGDRALVDMRFDDENGTTHRLLSTLANSSSAISTASGSIIKGRGPIDPE